MRIWKRLFMRFSVFCLLSKLLIGSSKSFWLEGAISWVGDVDPRRAAFRQHEGHEHDQIFAAFIAGIVRVVAGIHEDATCWIHFAGAARIIAMINGQVARYDCCPKGSTMLMPAEYAARGDRVSD